MKKIWQHVGGLEEKDFVGIWGAADGAELARWCC